MNIRTLIYAGCMYSAKHLSILQTVEDRRRMSLIINNQNIEVKAIISGIRGVYYK